MTKRIRAILTAAAVAAGAGPALGGGFSANFDDGALPAGTQIFGNGTSAGVIELNGGVADSGCLKLTKNANGLQGTFLLDDLDGGNPVNGFTARFKLRLGGGSAVPADGCSFCVGNDLGTSFGEAGSGSGLRIGFDIYDNTDGNPNNDAGEAPAINVFWNGALVSRTRLTLAALVTNTFADVLVRINNNGTLDLSYNGTVIHTALSIGYQPIAGAAYGWGGRTGGLNTNQFVDDIEITSTTGALAPYITRQPISLRVASGYPARFNVLDNAAAGVVYQWERKRPADATFAPVGDPAPAYVTPVLSVADSGSQYRVTLSSPEGIVVSDPATVEVVSLDRAAPTATFNFNEGVVPAGSGAFGSAVALPSDGFAGTGCMNLTDAVNAVAGTWTVDDLNGGQPVESIEVFFKLNMSNGTVPPADGFGFHWAPDLPDAGFPVAEEPVGNGLSVTFDVYDSTDGNPFNGVGEAPAIDVFWLRNRVGGTIVPLEFLNTQGEFQDVFLRLSSSGKIDVMFNGIVLVYQQQVPNWTAFSQARYGFSARTGGLNQRHAIDEVEIRSTLYAGPIAVIAQPQDTLAVVNRTATFSVISNDPTNALYQWQWKGAGAADFSDIPGATSASYTTPLLVAADNASQYRCRVYRTTSPSSVFSNAATLTVVDVARPTAPDINDTFNDGFTVTNTGAFPATVQTLSGNAIVLPDGGTGASGSLLLTEAVNTQFGTLVIDDFKPGVAIGEFTAAINTQIVGGNPADGWSFSWSDSINPVQAYGGLENGVGDDLRIGFITYGGSGVGVLVNWRGTQLIKVPVPLALLQSDFGVFEETVIRLRQDVSGTGATLTVVHDGTVIIRDLVLPGFQGLANGRFAVAARTGGLNEEHRYDDIAISTKPYTGPIAITQQPQSVRLRAGLTTTLTVGVNDPGRTVFQWQSRAPGAGTFSNIPGATASSYTTPLLTTAMSGTTYRCVCTAPSNTLTSNEAVVTVIEPDYPTAWNRIIDFNDGQIPADGAVLGSAVVFPTGGVADTGMVQLTPAANGLTGSFTLADQNSGVRVLGFATRFRLRIGDGTNPPADGTSFVWSPEAIDQPFGEDGSGGGLVVSFDIYDNEDGNPDNEAGEAPAIEARWAGVSMGNIRVPRSVLETGSQYTDVFIRVNPEGTLDVVVGNTIAYWKTPIPGFTPLAGATFGWGARTGGLNAIQEVDEIALSTTPESLPGLSIAVEGSDIVVTFQGILQTTTGSAAGLDGWTDVPGATNPYRVPLSSATGRRFWRVR